jgi:hypothetical protein
MRSKATIVLVAILVAPAVAALAAIVSAQESDVPTDIRGESLTCPSGAQVESRFTLNGDAWVVTGILQTGLTGTITVSGPTGDVSVTPTVNLAITGNPQLGQPVTMAGKIAMTGEMVATTIVDACAAAPAVPVSPSAEDDPAAQPVSNEDGDKHEEASDDSDDAEGDDDGDGEASAGNEKIAEAIAEEFDTSPDEVLALHGDGIGFGAIFKLYLIARANDMTVGDLLAQVDEDGDGFAFGKLKKSLTEEEMAIFEDGPKNLGELVSSSNHDDSDDSEDADEEDKGKTSRSGPSSQGKAKGHGKKD